jgi:hypothetical protein
MAAGSRNPLRPKIRCGLGHAPDRIIDVEEGDPVRNSLLYGSGIHRTIPGIDFGRHASPISRQIAQHPLDVARRGQSSGAA